MFKKPKRILLTVLLFIIGITIFINSNQIYKNKLVTKEVNIEEILKTEAYAYLPEKAKDYIREKYYNEGIILLTEKNKKENVEYLNPLYIEYLEDENKYPTLPSKTIVDYVEGTVSSPTDLPSKYDLRNVDGKNYVTPFKNQGNEGLCWNYATNAHIESLLLLKANKSYDETAVILSEKQIDYATAGDRGMNTPNRLYDENSRVCENRELSEGGVFECSIDIMLDGLGIVPNSWDQQHADKIGNNEPLKGSDIYNFDNSLYEVNSTISFPQLDLSTANESTRTSYLNAIKENIINYGGAYVSTDVCYDTVNYYNGVATKVVDVMKGGGCVEQGPHALQIIGWDDDFEYTVCKNTHGSITPDDCGTGGSVSGKGVWILKNSWGNVHSIVLLAYDSIGTDIEFVSNIGTRNWNNFYKLDRTYVNSTTSTYKTKENTYMKTEKLEKIKFKLQQNSNYKIYLDNGNGYSKIGEINSEFPGYYFLNFENDNITISSNSIIKLVSSMNKVQDLRVYTSNIDDEKDIFVEDIKYNSDNEYLNGTKFYDFYLYSQTKNITNNTLLNIKIKDKNGVYMPEESYTFTNNDVYANISTAKLTIDSTYFNKGNYTIETYYDGTNYNTSNFLIDTDFYITEGDGSSSNPWKITSPREFNNIRNNSNDNFILMNDIDFEYDTKNENGLFYNDGFGFEAIKNFAGYIDGNGHQIKNLYSKSKINSSNSEVKIGGIFENYGNCKNNYCGFKNIIISNPEIIGAYDTGGLINNLEIGYKENYIIENISVLGGTITNIEGPSYVIGGVIGYLLFTDDKDFQIKNLYNSANIKGSSKSNMFMEQLGGVIGSIGGEAGGITVGIDNLMNTGKITPSQYASSTGGIASINGGMMINLKLNNLLSLNSNYDTIGINSEIADYSYQFSMEINNVYTDSEKVIDSVAASDYLTSSNNTISNKSIYELANADYSNWTDFNINWTQYSTDGVKRIPIIKGVPFDYFKIEDETKIKMGNSVDILNLIENEKYNNDLEIQKNCNYELDICNTSTDDNIISINETTVTGLKEGETPLIIKNKHDGYINLLNIKVSNTNKIIFNSNGGTGTMNEQEFEEEVTLNENTFTKENYTFKEWNTKADGTGTSYSDKQTITTNEDLTLYAIWKPITYQITFDANGGTGTMNNQTYDSSTSNTLNENTFTKENYTFKEWNTKSDGTGTSYSDKQTITLNEDITLYAIWEKEITYIIRNYDVDETNNYISKIMINTEVNSFTPNFTLGYGYGLDIEYKEIDNKQLLYTGSKTKITKGLTLYKEYTNIVIGDINGDAAINSADLLKIRQHLLGTNILNGAYFLASDINYDSEINSADLLKIRQHLLGIAQINNS